MSCQQSQKQCQPPPKCPSPKCSPKCPPKSTTQCLPAASSCCATSSGGCSLPSSEGGCCLSHHRRRSHRCRRRSSSSCDRGSGQQSGGLRLWPQLWGLLLTWSMMLRQDSLEESASQGSRKAQLVLFCLILENLLCLSDAHCPCSLPSCGMHVPILGFD